MKDFKTTFFFLKLPIALSMAGHGLVRLPKLATFSEWMVSTMEKSILPSALIIPFSYVLPVLEAIVGIALLVGFRTRYSLLASLGIISVLIFGSSTIENWGAVQAQLIHALYLGFLLWYYDRHAAQKQAS